MKKRILSFALALCTVLSMIPFAALGVFANGVDGVYYDSPYARDVVFGDVPVTSWYTGLGGTLYEENAFGLATDYATYMTAFDTMAGFGDLITEAGSVASTGYDAKKWYADIPQEVKDAMNVTLAGGYVSREVMGKGTKNIEDIYNWVDPEKNTPGVDLATRETQYIYAYTFDPTKEEGYTGAQNIPKLVINTGAQSDELGSIAGVYYLINDILYNWQSSPVLDYLRHNVKLVVIPCLSPGGINQETYWNANFVNICRNHETEEVPFVSFMTGGYGFEESAGGDWVAVTENDTVVRYDAVAAGTGTHTQVMVPNGIWNKDGTDAYETRTQNSGYAAFDQSESLVLHDILNKHSDIFYFVDHHTQGSGNRPEGDWINVNWHLKDETDDEYFNQISDAVNWHVDRLSKNFYEEYDLSQFGVQEGQYLGYESKDLGAVYTSKWVASQNVLSSVLEGISGWPGGVMGGRYAPSVQKACSEILGNWLIAVLGQYAYDGEYPAETYSTKFSYTGENFPVLSGFPQNDSTGKYDTSSDEFPVVTPGNEYTVDLAKYPLSYQGNWTVGYKLINSTQASTTLNPFTKNPDNFTPYDSVWVYSGSAKSLWLSDATAATNGLWSHHGGFSMNYPNDTNHPFISALTVKDGAPVWSADTTVRYTAEYDGLAVIELSNLIFHSNATQLLVMKNGVVIGSVKAGDTSSAYVYNATTGGWDSGSTAVAGVGGFTVSVNKGDHIDFVNHTNPDVLTVTSENYATNIEKLRRGLARYTFTVSYYEQDGNYVNSYYSGTASAVTDNFPLSSSIETFLTWSSTGSLAGATATVNQKLIEAGFIEEGDSWSGAIDGYLEYLRSLPKMTNNSGWVPGALEKAGDPTTAGDVFSPINRYSVFYGNNILSVSGSSYKKGFVDGETIKTNGFVVSENYYELQLKSFAAPARAISVDGTAKDIVISYDTHVATLASVGVVNPPNWGNTFGIPVAFINYSTAPGSDLGGGEYRGVMMSPWYRTSSSSGNVSAALRYTVPSGVRDGLASVELGRVFVAPGTAARAHNFAIRMNGNVLSKGALTPNAQAADMQDRISSTLGKLPVVAGDTIDLVFEMVDQPVYIAPELTVTVKKDTGNALYGKFTGNKNAFATTWPAASSVETFLTWPSTALAGTSATINENLINAGWIEKTDTWSQAVDGYLNYLRSLPKLESSSGWVAGALEAAGNAAAPGDVFSPLTRFSIFDDGYNIFSVSGSNYYKGFITDDARMRVVSENYYEAELSYIAASAYALNIAGTADTLTVPYETVAAASVNKLIPPHWGPAIGYPVAMIEYTVADANFGSGAYRGATVAHWYNNGGQTVSAYRYTVPEGVENAQATLTLDNMFTYSSTTWTYASWFLNGTAFSGSSLGNGWGLSGMLNGLRNKIIENGTLTLSAGDTIDLRFARADGVVWVAPAMTIESVDTDTQTLTPVHRVKFASAGKTLGSTLASSDTSLAEVLAAYDASYAANGCYVNGEWYDAQATLPNVGDMNVDVDNRKITTAASIGIGATYALNLYLEGGADVAAAGVKIFGNTYEGVKQEDGQYKVTLAEVYAKDLLDANVSYLPYYVMQDGTLHMVTKSSAIEAKELLTAYITGNYSADAKALAQAALDYTTVAKAYFAGETADAATLARLATYDDTIKAQTASTALSAGEKYTFTAATLQIGETINFVVAIGNKDGSALSALSETLTIDGTEIAVSEFTATSINGQKVMVAVVQGVPEAKFAESLTFRLADATLTYSVKDYCVRNLAGAAEAEKNMIRAVYALGACAEAYTA